MLSVLQDPMRRELALDDLQLGILSGPTFALFYAAVGLPVARLAERYHRPLILAICLVIWSVMTSLCGFAQGYASLLAYRVGVGIGEAGGNPTSHSMIGDYFGPARRAFALAIYSLGAPAGLLIGGLGVGAIASAWGWRAAFVVFGVPGIVLAVLTLALIPEPPRGWSELEMTDSDNKPASLMTVAARLLSREDFRYIAVGSALTVLGGYAINFFLASFLIRRFGLSLAEVGTLFGLIAGGAAAIGTLGGGLLVDRFARHDARNYMRLPALCVALAGPLYAAAFLSHSLVVTLLLLAPATVAIYVYFAPAFALTHAMVLPRMRATAAALLFLLINLVGLGIGPPLIGFISDRVSNNIMLERAGEPFRQSCTSTMATDALSNICKEASAQGIRWALATLSIVFVLAGVQFWLAGFCLRSDLSLQVRTASS